MRKKYIFGFCFLLFGLLAIYKWTVKQSENEILVTVDKHLDINKVKIEFGIYNSILGNDLDLTKNGLDKIIYKNAILPFETICGENDFYMTYDNKYYTVLRHFIPNDFYDGIPKPHKYHFDLKLQNECIYLNVKITGQYEDEIEKKLIKIESSKENFWGSQLKTTNENNN